MRRRPIHIYISKMFGIAFGRSLRYDKPASASRVFGEPGAIRVRNRLQHNCAVGGVSFPSFSLFLLSLFILRAGRKKLSPEGWWCKFRGRWNFGRLSSLPFVPTIPMRRDAGNGIGCGVSRCPPLPTNGWPVSCLCPPAQFYSAGRSESSFGGARYTQSGYSKIRDSPMFISWHEEWGYYIWKRAT